MPFADYSDFDDCVSKNQDKSDPQAYCAEIKRKTEKAMEDKKEEKPMDTEKQATEEKPKEEETSKSVEKQEDMKEDKPKEEAKETEKKAEITEEDENLKKMNERIDKMEKMLGELTKQFSKFQKEASISPSDEQDSKGGATMNTEQQASVPSKTVTDEATVPETSVKPSQELKTTPETGTEQVEKKLDETFLKGMIRQVIGEMASGKEKVLKGISDNVPSESLEAEQPSNTIMKDTRFESMFKQAARKR